MQIYFDIECYKYLKWAQIILGLWLDLLNNDLQRAHKTNRITTLAVTNNF